MSSPSPTARSLSPDFSSRGKLFQDVRSAGTVIPQSRVVQSCAANGRAQPGHQTVPLCLMPRVSVKVLRRYTPLVALARTPGHRGTASRSCALSAWSSDVDAIGPWLVVNSSREGESHPASGHRNLRRGRPPGVWQNLVRGTPTTLCLFPHQPTKAVCRRNVCV